MSYPDFVAAGAEIIGVSPDSEETLEKYREARHAPFRFVSDTSRTIGGLYRACPGRRFKRVTYVIERGGTIRAALHHEIRIDKHISSSLDAIRALG